MPYFKDINTIFCHIPKTAGESVVSRLHSLTNSEDIDSHYFVGKHETMYQILNESKRLGIQNSFMKSFKFSIIRNPWDRYYSWYRYRKTNTPDDCGLCKYNCEERFLSSDFNSWVSNLIDYRSDKSCKYFDCPYNIIAQQCYFLVDSAGFILVDDVLRFEDISLWVDFANKNGIGDSAPLDNKNQSTKRDSYYDVYSDKSIDIIEKYSSYDLKYFGYKFK